MNVTSGDVRASTRNLVAGMEAHDELESEHRSVVLDWIDSGAPIWRTEKPATPPMHLVAYSVVIDPATHHVLLVDHRRARRWLPTGGHVEPGEHPAVTARRELTEELAIEPRHHPAWADRPVLVTVTTTVGIDAPHDDVSLWFAFTASMDTPLRPDPGEFADVRWWRVDDVRHGDDTRFDPHLPRFLAKVAGRAG